MKVIFHNRALTGMLNGEKDLDEFINKIAFKAEENDLPLSLALAATNKYSD